MYMIPSENLACLALTNRSDGREFAFSISNLRFLRFFCVRGLDDFFPQLRGMVVVGFSAIVSFI